ncbi:MAG: hypothetical protein ABSD80_12785 [Caulobacteraceae bacterium]|jgi:hypothetical protein
MIRRRSHWLGAAAAAGGLCLPFAAAHAVPSYATQTGSPCQACHVGGFGPQLTPYGRAFKLHGYTTRSGGFTVPISAMAVASYIRTQKDQESPPAPHYGVNDNVTIDQVSLFVAGGVGHVGAFIQATYDGVARAFHWDNLDIRATTDIKLAGKPTVIGVSLNNAPTLTDPFNTLVAWGYPYTTSTVAPSPAAAPLIGGLAQTSLGANAYAWFNSQLYLEAGGYVSPSANFLTRAGVDPTDPGNINGVAPYLRIAYDKSWGQRNLEVGAFAMKADIYPGHDESAYTTDKYTDVGLDASFQKFAHNGDAFTVNGRYTYEDQRLDASQALGLATSNRLHLQDLRVDASYYWRNEIGFTVQAFDTWGPPDQLIYAANSTFKPASSGVMLQVDGTPFGAGNSPLGKRFNVRMGLQYTDYFTFDGAGSNYDGFGRNAHDNNTLRLFTWVAY